MLLEKNDKLLFIGDSVSDYNRARPVGEGMANGWGTSYVADVGALLCCMYPELDLRIVSMGINGNEIGDLENRWDTDVMAQKPDYVTVLVGINDVCRQLEYPQPSGHHASTDEYEAAYRRLIEKTLPQVKGMILMAPYFMEPSRSDGIRAKMDQYGAIVRKLAEEYHLIFVDLQAGWDRLFKYMHPCNIAWDRLHPNPTGCMYIAKQFLQAIGAGRA